MPYGSPTLSDYSPAFPWWEAENLVVNATYPVYQITSYLSIPS